MLNEKVSIIILVHNAFWFCRTIFKTLLITDKVDYEITVVDNSSRLITKIYLWFLFVRRKIARICFLNKNTFFSEGNNIGANIISRDSNYILFLNSDIRIYHPLWLRKLLDIHEKGVTAYGVAGSTKRIPARADGFCFLINKELYLKYQFDERFKFWWSITKLEAELLRDGYVVKAIKRYQDFLYHYGKGSGKVPQRSPSLR